MILRNGKFNFTWSIFGKDLVVDGNRTINHAFNSSGYKDGRVIVKSVASGVSHSKVTELLF